MPAEVEAARAAGLFTLPAPASPGARDARVLRPHGALRLTEGSWRVPVLLVSFSNQPPAFAPVRFQVLLFDTLGANPIGSFADYYREVSRGKLRVTGDVFGWYSLPNTREFYAYNAYGLRRLGFPNNDAGLIYHAVAAADPDVDFSRYDRNGDGEVDAVLLVHVGLGAEAVSGDRNQLWSVTSALGSGWPGAPPYPTQDLRPGYANQYMKVNAFCILPERSSIYADSLTEIGTYCHEFGHILGWPDLYDASTLGGGDNLGPGNWCLMGSGSFGGDSRSPERPARPCAWTLQDAAWVTVENLTASGPFSFPPIQDADGRAYRMWWQGEASPEHFLLETRVRQGYDANLPAEGLIVYHVDEDVIASRRAANAVNSGSIPGLRLEEADGIYHLMSSLTRGDDGDPFPGSSHNTRFADETRPSARSYSGRHTNLLLSEIEYLGGGVRAWVQVDPSGWEPPEQAELSARFRLEDTRPSARHGPHLWLLGVNESDSSRVYALRRAYDLAWGPLEGVGSQGGATEPAWADPIAGPLTALWSDRRLGNPEIWYRRWAPERAEERRATFSPGFANHPAGAWLSDGRLALLWLDTRGGNSQLYFKAFLEGQEESAAEVRVTDPDQTAEVLDFSAARSAGGHLLVAYTGRGPSVDEVYMQRFEADSGWSAPQRLSQHDGYLSGSPDVVYLPVGYFRFAWRDNSPTRTLVQTAVFDPVERKFLPEPPTLFSSPFSLPSLRLGPGQGAELATVIARASEPPFDRVLFAGQHPDKAWDYGLGWISRGSDAGGSNVCLNIDQDGVLTALWATVGEEGTTLWTRRRVPATVVPVAVPPPPPTAPGAAVVVQALPNPARGLVRFRCGSPEEASALALYSISGRRVARLPAAGGEAQWAGLDEQGAALRGGIYFYRLEDSRGLPLSPAGKLVWLP